MVVVVVVVMVVVVVVEVVVDGVDRHFQTRMGLVGPLSL